MKEVIRSTILDLSQLGFTSAVIHVYLEDNFFLYNC